MYHKKAASLQWRAASPSPSQPSITNTTQACRPSGQDIGCHNVAAFNSISKLHALASQQHVWRKRNYPSCGTGGSVPSYCHPLHSACGSATTTVPLQLRLRVTRLLLLSSDMPADACCVHKRGLHQRVASQPHERLIVLCVPQSVPLNTLNSNVGSLSNKLKQAGLHSQGRVHILHLADNQEGIPAMHPLQLRHRIAAVRLRCSGARQADLPLEHLCAR